jgi:hypothetical protein
MNLEEKVCQIVKDITKKNPVYNSEKIFHQDSENIYYKHYTELIHEFAHWIVSSFKEKPNLGFEESFDYDNNNFPVILYFEEMKSRYLTYKFIKTISTDSKDIRYAEYLLHGALLNEKFEDQYYSYSKTQLKKATNKDLSKNKLKFIWKDLKNIRDNHNKNYLYENRNP